MLDGKTSHGQFGQGQIVHKGTWRWNGRKRLMPVAYGLIFLLLFMSVGSPAYAVVTAGGLPQNPPLDVINQKIETIARQKGIPPVLLKAIAYKESAWRQWDSAGNVLMAGSDPNPAIGIMQVAVTANMTAATIQRLQTDIDFNIATGADILNQKWASVPKIGDGDRNKLENWYFALWAYNNWSGKNNPRQLSAGTTSNAGGPSNTGNAGGTSGAGTIPGGTTGISGSGGTNGTAGVNTGSTTNTGNIGNAGNTSSMTNTGSTGNTGSAGSTGSTGNAGNPAQAYQDKILALCAQPQAFLSQYIQPVTITKIPPDLLPATGVPAAGSLWNTPQPVHYGGLSTAVVPQRIAGSDHIATAIQQAQLGWPQGSAAVILARSDDFPDALAGAPLAGQLGAPVLLTPSTSLDLRVLAELTALHPAKIYLLGGTGALGPQVTAALTAHGWDATEQVRIAGADRYATAAAIAGSLVNPASTVFVADGDGYADALAVAGVAGLQRAPVLLTATNGLPVATQAELIKLHPSQVYLVGGLGVISQDVAINIQQLLGLAPQAVVRLAGADRYGTMAAVAERFGGTSTVLDLATGEDFPDALTGAALTVRQQAFLILVPPDSLALHPELDTYLTKRWPTLSQVYIFGDEEAVSPARVAELTALGGR